MKRILDLRWAITWLGCLFLLGLLILPFLPETRGKEPPTQNLKNECLMPVE